MISPHKIKKDSVIKHKVTFTLQIQNKIKPSVLQFTAIINIWYYYMVFYFHSLHNGYIIKYVVSQAGHNPECLFDRWHQYSEQKSK